MERETFREEAHILDTSSWNY